MAGDSKQQRLASRVYDVLQSLRCPLVEGLYLSGPESKLHLLCSPSQQRTEILRWTSVSICPSLKQKLSTITPTQKEEMAQELLRFAHEMMLCKASDQDLIKGLAPPLRQLLFWEQLVLFIQEDLATSSRQASGDQRVRNDDLLGELLAPASSSDLSLVLNPVCNPWSAHSQDLLVQLKQNQKLRKPDRQASAEAKALLESTQRTLEELRQECEFPQTSAGELCPAVLTASLSELAHHMTAFRLVYSTYLKTYCHKAPPSAPPTQRVFQSVHQLLRTCTAELEAVHQLWETSTWLRRSVQELLTQPRFWLRGRKETLPKLLEDLKKRYTTLLSLQS